MTNRGKEASVIEFTFNSSKYTHYNILNAYSRVHLFLSFCPIKQILQWLCVEDSDHQNNKKMSPFNLERML